MRLAAPVIDTDKKCGLLRARRGAAALVAVTRHLVQKGPLRRLCLSAVAQTYADGGGMPKAAGALRVQLRAAVSRRPQSRAAWKSRQARTEGLLSHAGRSKSVQMVLEYGAGRPYIQSLSPAVECAMDPGPPLPAVPVWTHRMR
jgi:hypothetical protein